MEQRSPEWYAIKAGKVSAGRVHDIITRTRSGDYTAQRQARLTDILLERLTGELTQIPVTRAMQWGIDMEAAARDAYSAAVGVLIDEIGWAPHPTIELAGCSPDGLVGDDGLVEIKCMLSHNHLDALLERRPAPEYFTQMQWQMACTQRAWCDYVCYDPRFPAKMQLMIVRIPRDDKFIATAEDEVRKFLSEVDEKQKMLEEMINERV